MGVLDLCNCISTDNCCWSYESGEPHSHTFPEPNFNFFTCSEHVANSSARLSLHVELQHHKFPVCTRSTTHILTDMLHLTDNGASTLSRTTSVESQRVHSLVCA